MLIKIILALILPCLLVILFTRVTYNHYVGTALTIALLIASIYKGYTHTSLINILDVLSLTAGFLYSRKMVKKFKE
ncbi:CsbA family protein [Litchfieldia salsa]|uniref:General stress protein CsbA n=1 Tax=Litchfieldia salsa TaxID=930152 RepID=A0A1H0WCA6_9BACI|nr:CsbA family protein [Litchfieldia salsa]SDP88390.1 General stress protein CsbA [Litchfieldia salsa]